MYQINLKIRELHFDLVKSKKKKKKKEKKKVFQKKLLQI